MKTAHVIFLFSLLLLAGCSYSAPDPVEVKLSSYKVDYLADVKPILDKRCVVCHSCYNSPCQAKFSSFDGVDRGGSKEKVYLAERLFAQKPTRLFVDAKTTQEWRNKKFFSLTLNPRDAENDETLEGLHYEESIMGHMLYDKKKNPKTVGNYAPETDDLICPETLDEVGEYQMKHPNHGMPYGFPSLDESEYNIIMQWLAQGAKGPSAKEQKALETPTSISQKAIDSWEEFLNQDDAKHKMTARYLYEHYFIAQINFDPSKREFYNLVRSTTPPGEKIDVIATRRPYDDPKVDKFYYRFKKIYSTIVHKTHILVEFNENELQRVNELFIDTPWLEEPHLMSYEKKVSANPFVTFAQIPPAVRYDFLLDHSEYIIRTFIRGPVCKGQIALNVIHDHFWVMFQDPKFDVGVNEPLFLQEQSGNLAMPIEAGSDERIYRVFSDAYRDKYETYYRKKMQKLIDRSSEHPLGLDSIWKGRDASSSPVLTVYRHFDSASVHKGVLGGLPRTMWVIDYAHFERIYYALVAGFDVFGNVSHQTNIRRYMDFLRIEGELNFIFHMPFNKRYEMFESWYIGDGVINDLKISKYQSEQITTAKQLKTDRPKQEFIERLVDTHFLKETDIHFDEINYYRRGAKIPSLPTKYSSEKDIERGMRALNTPGSGFIKHISENGLNIIHIRVIFNDGSDMLGTLVVNRWHDNVNSLFGEEGRLHSDKDTLDIFQGNVGSYPNVFTVVHEDDVPDFFDLLVNYDNSPKYIAKIRKYGISRGDENFWQHYDWFQKRFNEDEPLTSGLYDLNRYYKTAW